MKVLIVRIGAMGDVLHALPAVAALKAAKPSWEIHWVVDQRWWPLLVATDGERMITGPVAYRAHPLDLKAWKAKPFSAQTRRLVRLWRNILRHEHYDLAVDMQGTLRSAVIGQQAAARQFVGWRDPREWPARLFYGERVQREGRHVVQQAAALLGQACGVALEPAVPAIPEEWEASAWARAQAARRKRCACWRPPLGGEPSSGRWQSSASWRAHSPRRAMTSW